MGLLKCSPCRGDLTRSPGTDRFDEAMGYVEKHRLYNLALSIWEGTENYKVSFSQLRHLWTPIDQREI